jgi:hypothetical protein
MLLRDPPQNPFATGSCTAVIISSHRRTVAKNNLFASFCDNWRRIINVGGPNNASDNIMPNSARKQIARWATFSSG